MAQGMKDYDDSGDFDSLERQSRIGNKESKSKHSGNSTYKRKSKILEGLKEMMISATSEVREFGRAAKEGDIFVKLSFLIMGIGYLRRGQIIKGLLVTLLQAAWIAYVIIYAIPLLKKFPTLGTVVYSSSLNLVTMQKEVNDYDHSFKILLFSLISLIIIAVGIFVYFKNIVWVTEIQRLSKKGKHVNKFYEDIRELFNTKFHITMLALPVLGVVTFTIIPLIVMICVAFTNYDQQHMPPNALFTWVGFENFKQIFTNSITISFGYSFMKVLSWTLLWALLATLTTYIGGIALAMFIGNKKTRWKGLWRTLFVITIAVPQFVSLLLVRYFFANSGIVNTILSDWGVTAFLQNIGLVSESLTYIPFLSEPHWAKFTILLINVWIGVPYQMLISTGVLMNIPEDLFESAKIDGAGPFQVFKSITMPYMLFVTGPYLITSFINNINNFNVIYLLTQDMYTTLDQQLANSNAKEIDLLVTWLFRLTQDYYNYKMASVIGIMVFVVCTVFTLLAFNYVIKGDKEERFQL